ncbi:MAG: glycosyltransferase family 10 domain-containing protein [bacterium]
MKTIYLNFVDFHKGFSNENNYFINLLRKKYNVVLSENPDFVICSVYSINFLKYNCIRIFYTGENYTPNFNLYDYGIGFDWLIFEDRYLRLPLYYIRSNSKHYNKCLHRFNYSKSDIQHRKFCNFVYSNSGADPKRKEFFEKLGVYKFVHSGGRYLNNIGKPVDDKMKFQQQFKFSIAFENSMTNGYTTEKILEAKVAGTVPVYWGNPVINREANTNAFVNCHDFDNFENVIEYIKYLDNNDSEFLKILNEPLFKKEIYDLNDEIVLDYFDNIIRENRK